ncbi:phytanoyl-CoA dioxygenase family protein [Mycobacterium xenopi 3993]|nr:phytanoyl-CoA dioxygenase family protein [Mycobacterium xenopi 3993]
MCDRLVDHPRVLAVLDRLLMPNYLLSALQVINIQPGESAQLLHHDDGFYPIPRPRAPLAAATIWAIDDFTADNGATVVVPGSHRWGRRRPGHTISGYPSLCPPARAFSSSAPFGMAAGQHHEPRPPCRHRSVLPTVAAPDGGLYPLGAARDCPECLR